VVVLSAPRSAARAAWRGGLFCEEAEVAALLEEVSATRHFEPSDPAERERHSLRDGSMPHCPQILHPFSFRAAIC
jgi:hypothetical protein